MDTLVDMLVAFAVTWGASALLARGWPVESGDFARHLRARVFRMLGRIVIVLVTLFVGIGFLGRSAAGTMIGGLAGWLVDAGREAWRCHTLGEDRR
jgi:hypothetical protein